MTRLQTVRVSIDVDTNKDSVTRHVTMEEGETTSEYAERVRDEIRELVEAVLQ